MEEQTISSLDQLGETPENSCRPFSFGKTSNVRFGSRRRHRRAIRRSPLYPQEQTLPGRPGMSEMCRYCCKSPKRRSGQFPAKERNKRQSPINRASNTLPESPVSLALGDVVPRVIIQSLHVRAGEFESHLPKRLLQQYLPEGDMAALTRSPHRLGRAVSVGW